MKGLRILAGATGLTLLAAGYAVASGGDGHGLPWDNFAYRVATFVIVGGILWKFAGKKAVGFFSGRRSGIEQELVDLETRKTDARKSLADVEQRIADLDKEREAILAEARDQAEAIKATIIEKAEKTAEQITAQAARTAESEMKQATEQMRAEMADLVVEAAEKLMAEKLTGDEQEKLIDKYLTKVVLN